jgi:putative GTP pyrophosphokinase
MSTNKTTLCGIELDPFLRLHDLSRTEFEATGLKVSELDAIALDYDTKRPELSHASNFVANTLQGVPGVHSVKVRLKNRDGLVAKIIRKRIENTDRVIDIGNYETEITDLIGARALHLFKDQWKTVSDFIRSHWKEHESPVAYYRKGDPSDVVEAFRAANLNPKEHQAGYRSIHHIISCSPSKNIHLIEIQVRTLIEEAWSEIDHIVRYPRKTDDKELDSFLMLFNAFAGNADSMGTFLMNLRQRLQGHAATVQQLKSRADAAESELQETISKLSISDADRTRLRKEVAKLHTVSVTSASSPYLTPNAGSLSLQEGGFSAAAAAAATAVSILSTTTKTCPQGHTFQKSPSSGISFAGTPCPICGAPTY